MSKAWCAARSTTLTINMMPPMLMWRRTRVALPMISSASQPSATNIWETPPSTPIHGRGVSLRISTTSCTKMSSSSAMQSTTTTGTKIAIPVVVADWIFLRFSSSLKVVGAGVILATVVAFTGVVGRAVVGRSTIVVRRIWRNRCAADVALGVSAVVVPIIIVVVTFVAGLLAVSFFGGNGIGGTVVSTTI